MSHPARPLHTHRSGRHRAHPMSWPLRPSRAASHRLLIALAYGAGAALLVAGLLLALLPLAAM